MLSRRVRCSASCIAPAFIHPTGSASTWQNAGRQTRGVCAWMTAAMTVRIVAGRTLTTALVRSRWKCSERTVWTTPGTTRGYTPQVGDPRAAVCALGVALPRVTRTGLQCACAVRSGLRSDSLFPFPATNTPPHFQPKCAEVSRPAGLGRGGLSPAPSVYCLLLPVFFAVPYLVTTAFLTDRNPGVSRR
jgi:hypothetical protein